MWVTFPVQTKTSRNSRTVSMMSKLLKSIFLFLFASFNVILTSRLKQFEQSPVFFLVGAFARWSVRGCVKLCALCAQAHTQIVFSACPQHPVRLFIIYSLFEVLAWNSFGQTQIDGIRFCCWWWRSRHPDDSTWELVNQASFAKLLAWQWECTWGLTRGVVQDGSSDGGDFGDASGELASLLRSFPFNLWTTPFNATSLSLPFIDLALCTSCADTRHLKKKCMPQNAEI